MGSSFIKSFNNFYNFCWEKLAPSTCIICTYPTGNARNICDVCKNNFPILPHHCIICASFLPSLGVQICGMCLRKKPAYDKCFAAYAYEWPLDQMVQRLKFQYQLKFARAISELMIDHIAKWYARNSLPEALFPMPLHHKRLQKRGFNQVIEFAKPIARQFKIILDKTSVYRTKNTLMQSSLRRRERRKNMRGAFRLTRNLTYKHVAIIDDVVTTGETISEYATLLHAKGIKKIDVWCFARRG